MAEIWLTSDTHFCHQREFLWAPRGFNSQYEMNEAIVENWNKIVNPEDTVYLLGDVMLNDNVTGAKLLHSLKGDIHLVCGNHDSTERIEIYRNSWNIVTITLAERLKYNGYHFFLCHYPVLCSNYDDGKNLKHKTICLCGHTHTKDPFVDWDKGCIYHVELDAHNCAPVNINKVISDLEQRYKP